jgi:hypothetical protein
MIAGKRLVRLILIMSMAAPGKPAKDKSTDYSRHAYTAGIPDPYAPLYFSTVSFAAIAPSYSAPP